MNCCEFCNSDKNNFILCSNELRICNICIDKLKPLLLEAKNKNINIDDLVSIIQ